MLKFPITWRFEKERKKKIKISAAKKRAVANRPRPCAVRSSDIYRFKWNNLLSYLETRNSVFLQMNNGNEKLLDDGREIIWSIIW